MDSLSKPASEDGALLALKQLPAWKEAGRLREYVKRRVESSLRFEDHAASHPSFENDRIHLLANSLQSRARRDGIFAFKALSLLNDRETISIAIDNLKSSHFECARNA